MKNTALITICILYLSGIANAQTNEDRPQSSQANLSAKHTPKPTLMMASGDFAGTFLCAKGEMGMSLRLRGGALLEMKKFETPCRSGSGPCNDRQKAMLARTYELNGVLNFFPTLGNPDAPRGAFEVEGSVFYKNKYVSEITLSPGKWIKQPTGFSRSGLIANLSPNGTLYGKPTADGCSKLRMSRLYSIQ